MSQTPSNQTYLVGDETFRMSVGSVLTSTVIAQGRDSSLCFASESLLGSAINRHTKALHLEPQEPTRRALSPVFFEEEEDTMVASGGMEPDLSAIPAQPEHPHGTAEVLLVRRERGKFRDATPGECLAAAAEYTAWLNAVLQPRMDVVDGEDPGLSKGLPLGLGLGNGRCQLKEGLVSRGDTGAGAGDGGGREAVADAAEQLHP